MMTRALFLWIEGTRPKTLIATLSPVSVGAVVAWSCGRLCLSILAVTLCCALLIQVGTNLANDYLDWVKGADSPDRQGPRRLAQSGLISVIALKRATLLCFGVGALLSLYLTWVGGWEIALLAALSITCGFLYTGGPYPLGYLGLGDGVVFLFFGPLATAGTAYLQLGTWSLTAALAGIAPGLLSTALLTANNLRDETSDRRAGKKTIPVRFGQKAGKIEYGACLIGAGLLPFFFVAARYASWPLVLTSSFLFSARVVAKTLLGPSFYQEAGRLLPETSKLLWLYTLFFGCLWPMTSH